MDSGVFHQKMKDLKQKLSSINDDIVEIQKNNKKKSFSKKDTSTLNADSNNHQIQKELIANKNNITNNEQHLDSLYGNNNDFLYNLTTPSPSETPKISSKKKFSLMKNFMKRLKIIKLKKI